MMDVIQIARAEGRTALTEAEAKSGLTGFELPFPKEKSCTSMQEAAAVANDLGYPLAVKGIGPGLLHKTEAGVVMLNIRNEAELATAWETIMQRGGDLVKEVLVQQFVEGQREFVIGMSRDPQFGPSIMFGQGGIFTEPLDDVTFRIAPVSHKEALRMIREPKCAALLGTVRGMSAVNRETLAHILVTISEISMKFTDIAEIDFNPVKVTEDGAAFIVDALITLSGAQE